MNQQRCAWAKSELAIAYHDNEWGVPVHDDRTLFEFLILEGAQAGLSWETILKKRATYREAFDQFDPVLVARYRDKKLTTLLANDGIVRNRLKIAAAVQNAQAFLAVQKEFGSFDAYVWRFVEGQPKQNARQAMTEVPANTPESDALSKDLKRRGFNFVGSTICYAFMQAIGMVNDHLVDCFRHADLSVCPKRGQAPLCAAPSGPFRQRCLTPFRTDAECREAAP
ncbi:MAG: DNA-3-methyladenine glycosylase I [Gemmataceae bacterium]|nr:DNA-3-methyladenine glycosylase I [Gemmataceae bacterium]